MTENMLAELREVVRQIDDAHEHVDAAFIALNFLRAHHAAIEAAVRDAGRYRHLRDWGVPEMCIVINASPSYIGSETDAAIDAALAAQHDSAREGM